MFVWSQIAISSIICRCMLPRFIRIHSPLTLTIFELVDNEVKDELHTVMGCHYLDNMGEEDTESLIHPIQQENLKK